MAFLRHPVVNRSYFWEYYLIKDEIREVFAKELSYDAFFGGSPEEKQKTAKYLDILIHRAQGTPVLECCRTFARVPAIRDRIGGLHLYLIRNPRNQWWSYKCADYFQATSLLILNAKEAPPVLLRLRKELGFIEFHDEDISREFRHFESMALTPEQSYLLHYTIWCYALLENLKSSDACVSVDLLSESPRYRDEVVSFLDGKGFVGLDFSDCAIPQAAYSSQEEDFFRDIESQAHALFLQSGHTKDDIFRMLEFTELHKTSRDTALQETGQIAKMIHEAERARELTIRFERDFGTILRDKNRLLREQSALMQRAQELELQLKELSDKIVCRDASLQATHEQLEQIRTLMDALGLEIERTRSGLEAVTHRAGILENDLASVQQQLALTTADRDEARNQAHQVQQELDRARIQLNDANERNHAIGLEIDQVRREAQMLRSDLHAVLSSRSWRYGSPLRRCNAGIKRIGRGIQQGTTFLERIPKWIARRLLLRALITLRNHPGLKDRVAGSLRNFRGLDYRLRSFAQNHPMSVPMEGSGFSEEPSPIPVATERIIQEESIDLSKYPPAVRSIYEDLKRAVETRRP